MVPQEPKGESFAALFERDANRSTPHRRSFKVGEQLDVVVVQIGRDAVFVELDGKQEGFIDSKDVSNKAGELTVKVGSRITARVAEVGGRLGAVRLSPVYVRPPASEEANAVPQAVEGAQGAVSVGSRVKGTVAVVERYGVFLQIGEAPGPGKRGVRGLIPASELGVPRGADLHKLFPVGTDLEAMVLAIDERQRIKLSVIALKDAAERSEFEAHKTKGTPGNQPMRGFGTLGDLLRKK